MASFSSFSQQGDGGAMEPMIVARPDFQLRSLPIRYRWEVSRRHPYYDLWWKLARSHSREEPCGDELEQHLRPLAGHFLGVIGISGEPPDPATDFAELEEEQLNAAWSSGAVHPISMRGLASLLIGSLPKNVLQRLSSIFFEASQEDKEEELPRKLNALQQLTVESSPELNCYFNEPFVSVNPAASARQISKDVTALCKLWKEQRALPEQRDRSDKYPEYLAVWDLREGWARGRYDRSTELKLKEIAKQQKMPIPTVHNHYRSAFEMIMGHPYSADLWYRLMGPIKLVELVGQELGRTSSTRPLKPRSHIPAPESRLNSGKEGDERTGFTQQLSCCSGDIEFQELISSIRSLLKSGRTDEQIVEALELTSPEAKDAIAYLRERDGELK